jgi:hypothetical protein
MFTLEDLRRQLGQQLTDIGVMYEIDPDNDFAIPFGNTIVFVRPLEHGGKKLVRVWVITNVDVLLSDELTRYLLTENGMLVFGGFHTHDSGKVALSHTLLAEEGILQRDELEAALGVVAAAANHHNAEIKARFGGMLFGEP